ncbi:hypothetical protein ACFV1L_06215 [Kitasatospora sp. NPDC059646]
MKNLLTFLAGLVAVLLLAGCLFVWTHAPCELWAFSSAGNTPGRCLR